LTHCGQLILRKISKFDTTICQILRLKCTKFDFRWGSGPEHAGGAYSDQPSPKYVGLEPTVTLKIRGCFVARKHELGKGRVREGWHFTAAKACGGSTVGGLLVKFLHFCLRFRTFHGLLGGQRYRVDCPPLTSGVSWSPDSATTQLRCHKRRCKELCNS